MVSSIFLGIVIKYCARYLKVVSTILDVIQPQAATGKGVFPDLLTLLPGCCWLLSDKTVKKALNQKPLTDCFG